MRCQLSSLEARSCLKPMAELWRNQRSEIGRQHVIKAQSYSHFSPCFDHTMPTQTKDGTSQIEHNIRAYVPYSFRMGSFTSPSN